MRYYKTKILCVLLTVCLSLGLMTGVSMAADKYDSEELTEKMEVLRLFEIIPDYYDFNTSFAEEVSRADFVDVAARLIKAPEYSNENVYYYDVLKTHYAYNSISMLTQMGIINGTGDKVFEPDAPIEDAAACKILLSLMGYGDMAYYNGGYPSGYVTVAKRLEFYNGSSTTNLSRGEMLNMIYDVLNVEIMSVMGFSDDDGATLANMGETLLSVYHNIYYDTGVVNGANCISLGDVKISKVGEVIIDEGLYVSEHNVVDYLGQEVEFFWYDNKTENKKELLWIKAVATNDVLYFKVDNNASLDSVLYAYTYHDANGRKTTISLDRGITLIYNGCVEEDDIASILNNDEYTVKFVRQNGVYNIAIVRAYENYIVDLVDVNKNIVYDKLGTKDPLNLKEDDYDYLNIIGTDGSSIDISGIKAGDVLSVFKSLDGKYKEIVVSAETKAGIISSIFEQANGYSISLADETCYMTNDAYTANPQAFSVGDNVTLYFDYTGTVAYVVSLAGSNMAAYVIDMAVVDGIFNDGIKLKMLLQDGAVAVMECEDEIVLDGASQAKAADIEAAFTDEDGSLKRELILIETNADGLIKKIDTRDVKTQNGESLVNSLSRRIAVDDQRYVGNSGIFAASIMMNEETTIFSVPVMDADLSDETKYRIITKTDLLDGTKYNIEAYNVAERVGIDEYVIVKMNSELSNGKTNTVLPVLVTGIGSIIDSEGHIAETIEAIQGVEEKTFISDESYSFRADGITDGMLLQLSLTHDGKVGGAELIFDPNAEFIPQTAISTLDTYMVNIGYVNDIIDNDVIKMGFSSGANVDYTAIRQSAPVVVYDTNSDISRAYVGSFADAKRYYNVGNDADCSKVVIISRYFTPKLYVIYN